MIPSTAIPQMPVAVTIVGSPEHSFPGHPESPDRFGSLRASLETAQGFALLSLPPTPAPADDLERVHPPEYLRALEAACRQGPAIIDPAPTYVTPDSYACACLAAGGTLAVLDAVLEKQAQAGMAIIRPPGHHAEAARAMGFCLLNNVAVAARRALALGLRRLMIFDFDVHHGNGTQAIFESDPSVLYISIHQEGIYPLTGWPEEMGVGEGLGTTINVPLPAGTGDHGALKVFDRIAAPASIRFQPEMILVSAGFDAHWRDPLAGLQLTTGGYFAIASKLVDLAQTLCGGRLVFSLEGGYDSMVVAEGVMACLAALHGTRPAHDGLGPAPHPEPDISDRILRTIALHGL
jgi:acetoin utilization deacetylase AcuC-like enzyme